MLIEDISYSIKQGNKYLSSKVAKNNVSDLEKIQMDLSPIIVDIIKLYAQRKVYEKLEDLEEENIKSIRGYLNSIRKDIELDNTEDILNNMSFLKTRITEEKNYLTKIWRTYKNDRINSYAKLINALANIIDNGEVLDELGKLKSDIDKVDVGNDKEIDMISDYIKKSKELIKSLSLDEDTEKFVISITDGEDISLADVKNSTMNWLEDHRLLTKIKLVL
ncbi:hypothetical protein [Butyrivibrio fibrisolvens]|uniref:hypothetical protein n=1 Tax=Butyrivibrio fibrisolvens TaxID=831 RepID=UPI0020BE7EB2|nr:hypothetical protein [Butyrivibrio fibrisolvens]